MRVESQPAGATVTLDGSTLGVTPLDVADLPLGSHELKLQFKGYAPSDQNVVLSSEAPHADINLTLSRTAPPVGTADVLSNPSGAFVSIDGIGIGKTPLREYRLKVGDHRVEVLADGYEPWRGSLSVREGKRERIDAFLKAVTTATPTPAPKPDVVDPNRVYLQGEVDVPPKKVSGGTATSEKLPRLKSKQGLSVTGTFVINENGEVTNINVTGTFMVDENGKATNIQVDPAAGQAFSQAAVASIRGRKYSPGAKKGVNVKVRLDFKQTFMG